MTSITTDRRGKDINLKVWPDVTDYIPALWPIPPLDKYARANDVNIDMQNVRSVTSTGLTLLLINVVKCIHGSKRYRKTHITESSDKEVSEQIRALGFFEPLGCFCETGLFWPSRSSSIETFNVKGRAVKSAPIYHLKFGNKKINRRNSVVEFVDWICEQFEPLEETYPVDAHHLMRIFQEMAKNSADHTQSDAFCGLDFYFDMDALRVNFVFGDLGIGVNKMIAKFLEDDGGFNEKDRHLSLSDSYHYAFKPGATTRPNSGENRGLGMSMIFDIAKEYGIRLSVFDANSCGVVTVAQNTSHSELRKVFYNSGRNVGFYYFGELELKPITNEKN